MADFGVLHLNELSIALITAVNRKVCRHALLPNSCMIVMYNKGMIKMMSGLISVKFKEYEGRGETIS